MKHNAIVRIVLFSIAIFLLSGILLAVLDVDMYMFRGNHETHTSYEASHIPEKLDDASYIADPDTIRDIKIDWAAGSITIQPSDRDNISVAESEVSDSKYRMVVRDSGNKLTIEYCEDATNFIGINKNYEAKHLTIFVPAGWTCSSLEIDAASAGLAVSDMAIGEVKFDGASGVCNFSNCQIDKLDIDTASGDVTFSGILEELDFDAMSAGFYATLSNNPRRMDIDSMSGDLDITLPENSGFTLNLDAMSSDFTSDFATTRKNDAYVCGDGACHISVSAMSGDVALRKHNANSHHVHDDSCYAEGSTCPDYSAQAEQTHNEDTHH